MVAGECGRLDFGGTTVVGISAGARCRDGPFGHFDRTRLPRDNGHDGSNDQGRRSNEPLPRRTFARMVATVGCHPCGEPATPSSERAREALAGVCLTLSGVLAPTVGV